MISNYVKLINDMIWFLRVLIWDGVLPLVLVVVPLVIRMAFPQFPDVVVPIAIILPIAAFFLRFYVGCCYITENHCGDWTRRVQSVSLVIGILALLIIDVMCIGTLGLPNGPIWNDPPALKVLSCIYGLYLVSMAMTLYPGPITTDNLGVAPE